MQQIILEYFFTLIKISRQKYGNRYLLLKNAGRTKFVNSPWCYASKFSDFYVKYNRDISISFFSVWALMGTVR
jgi:hypothetical protein